MSIERLTKQIDNTTFELTTWGAKDQQHVLVRLLKVLGPAFGTLTMQAADVEKAIAAATAALSDADLDYIDSKLAGATKVCLQAQTTSGTREMWVPLTGQYDALFAGHLDLWLAWLAWGLQANFASFFSGKLAGHLGDLLAGFASQPTATGESGASSPTRASTSA
jgi:hypothetical protein